MSVWSDLWSKLERKKYRDSFSASVVKRMIPLQIRVLRKQRDWSQVRLAKEAQLTQGVISRAEDPEYGNLTVNTLVRIGAGFDCAYIGRFVPYSELGRWYSALEHEKELEVLSFEDDKRAQEEAEQRMREAMKSGHVVSLPMREGNPYQDNEVVTASAQVDRKPPLMATIQSHNLEFEVSIA